MANRCDDVYLAVRVEGSTEYEKDNQVKADSYITVFQSRPKQKDSSDIQEEISILKVKLRQSEETAQKVQREVRGDCCLWAKTSGCLLQTDITFGQFNPKTVDILNCKAFDFTFNSHL